MLQTEFGAESVQRLAESIVNMTAVDKPAAVIPVLKYECSVNVVIVENSSHLSILP